MGGYCVVRGCKNSGGHAFPKEDKLKKAWIALVQREAAWYPSRHSKVCYDHFLPSDYSEENRYGVQCMKKQLKNGAVPSVFWWKAHHPEQAQRDQQRGIRRGRRPAGIAFEKELEKRLASSNTGVEVQLRIQEFQQPSYVPDAENFKEASLVPSEHELPSSAAQDKTITNVLMDTGGDDEHQPTPSISTGQARRQATGWRWSPETVKSETDALRSLTAVQQDIYIRVQRGGMTVNQVAAQRYGKPCTVVKYLIEAMTRGLPVDLYKLGVDTALLGTVYQVLRNPTVGSDVCKLTQIKRLCPSHLTWDQLRTCLLIITKMRWLERGPPMAMMPRFEPAQPKAEPATPALAADRGGPSPARCTALTTIGPTRPLVTVHTRYVDTPHPGPAGYNGTGPPTPPPQLTPTRVPMSTASSADGWDDWDPDEAEIEAAQQRATKRLARATLGPEWAPAVPEVKFRWPIIFKEKVDGNSAEP